MIKKSSRRKYRRLLLFYSLVIIIPGTFLGILAYRGIQNNRIAEVKIRDDRLVRKSRYFESRIEETINTYIDDFSDGLINTKKHFISLDSLAAVRKEIKQGMVLNAAIWESDGSIKLLDQTTLFVPEDFWKRSDPQEPGLQKLIIAQSLEILRQLPEAASVRYEEVLDQTTDPLFQFQALAGLARIRKNQNNLMAALKLYEQIDRLSNHPDVVPLFKMKISHAFSEMVAQLVDEQITNTPVNLEDLMALELLSFIGLPQICLTESEFTMLYQKNRDRYDESLRDYLDQASRDNCDSLFLDLEKGRVQNRAFCQLYNSIERSLSTVGSSRRLDHVSGIQDTLSVVFSCKAFKGLNLGLLMNISAIMRVNFAELDDTISFPRRIAWSIEGPDEQLFAQSINFNANQEVLPLQLDEFGNWTLELHEVGLGRFGMLNEAGQIFYFLVFIFVLVAMAIGLLLAIRLLTADYRLSMLKSDFVSTVSHEFKSPLTSIRMMSERLANQRVKSEERKLEYYNSMLSQSERLSHLVENILDFSRLDEGRKAFHFEPCNLTRIVGEVIEYLSIRTSETGIKIEFNAPDDPVIGIVDSQGIHQVIFNLVDNAIKYSGDSRRVEVMLESTHQTITISVRDFGIGIAKKDKKRIFSRFYRSDRVHIGSIKGSGIGLSIVYEIVKAHQGHIELESEINKGSTFSVYIPVNQSKS